MVDGGLCMAAEGQVKSIKPLLSQIQQSREGVRACSQEEGHLACWEALHDSPPDLIGIFQFCSFKDLSLNS